MLSDHENEPRMAKLVRGYSGDVRKAFVALAGVSPSPRAGDCLSAGVGVRFVLAMFHLSLIGSGRAAARQVVLAARPVRFPARRRASRHCTYSNETYLGLC